MPEDKQKRSIIDHTTTCPYCGHRVLHENLQKHIQSQHPGEAEQEDDERKFGYKRYRVCFHCGKRVLVKDLRNHIKNEHPDVEKPLRSLKLVSHHEDLGNGWIRCKYCKSKVRKKNLTKHLGKVHHIYK